MFTDYPEIMCVEEVAETLKIGYDAIHDFLRSGKLKGFYNGCVWRVSREALIQYVRDSSNLYKSTHK